MSLTTPTLLLDEITDFLASNPNPQAIIDFKPSEALAQRALELLQLNREQHLSPSEHAEMEEFMRMDHFMTLLKAKSHLKLQGEA